MCEKHFRKEDILREVEYFDKKTGRILKSQLLHPRPKEGALPMVLPSGCPSYLQPTAVTSRESPDAKRRRIESCSLQKALEESKKTELEYEKAVTFSSVQELHENLKKQTVDEFWTICLKADCLLIMHISSTIPEILCSIVVNNDLNLNIHYRKVCIQNLGKLKFPSRITNINLLFTIMSSMKDFVEKENNSDCEIKIICDVLIYLFDKLKINTNFPKSSVKFVDFVIEQIVKINVSKNQFKHSPDLLVFCSLLKSISPHCYKFLRNSGIFILPHPGTLRRICSEFRINPSDEQDDQNFLMYVKQKFTSLNDQEKVITLMIDEIHLKSSFDYVGGKLTGMSFSESEAASSAYVFMIQSLLSKYKDVGHILPVSTLTAEQFYSIIKKVIIGLEKIGFNVIAVVTDNNSINRKAMTFFSSPPKLNRQYNNPVYPERPLFFIIDPVHIIKCIRNNWLNQNNPGQCMFYPNFDTLLPFNTASFQALKKLHEAECGKLLKYGYSLTLKALCPSSLERQNVKLALQVLNNVTAEALLVVGKEIDIEHFKETAEYIKIIHKWWCIMNVKTLYKGEHKLDNFQEPLTSDTNDVKYDFLDKFVKWLEKWDDMKCNTGGLTKQTHLALSHTTTAMLAMAKYCFSSLNFSFFLPGKVQTDPLEDRFGSYRQLSGSQYCISIRQVYETETKLRVQSILPLILKSKNCGEFGLSLFDDKKDWVEMQNCTNIDSLSKSIIITPDNIVNAQTDISILTYVSGYAVHVVMKKLKCEQCNISLMCDQSLDVDINNEWISKLDRGGLKYPHPDIVCITVFNYAVVKKLLSSDYEDRFLRCQNQRCVVYSITLDVLQENDVFIGIDDCEYGHDLKSVMKQIVWVTTNILLKNYCKKQNDMLHKKKLLQKRKNEQKLKQDVRKLDTLKK